MGELTTNPLNSAGHRRRLMQSLSTSPTAGQIAEAKRLLEPMRKTPQTAVDLGAKIKTLLSFYWRHEDDARLSMANLAAWQDDLGAFPMWAVDEAMTEWRRTRTHRPTPAHIRGMCLDLIGGVSQAVQVAEAEPEPERKPKDPETMARVDAVVEDFLKHRRFGAKKPRTHGSAA